jgi:hypothetical protein
MRAGPTLARVRERAQWVGSASDSTALETFGQSYVFADFDQTEVGASLSLNWAFTPNLSLQMYAQPLISTGNYQNFMALARSRSYDFVPVGSGVPTYDKATDQIDLDGPGGPGDPFNPDFTIKSLRGNAVLRWEYRPGSTLYLVWTQQRDDNETLGDFEFGRSVTHLMAAKPDNIFLAKLTYYFAL